MHGPINYDPKGTRKEQRREGKSGNEKEKERERERDKS